MTISNYTDLQAAMAKWMHREDLTSVIPDFITLAEARFNRVLRTRSMLASFASVALVNGAASLPADFLAFKELRYDGDNSYTLEPRPLEWLRSKPADPGQPGYFAVTANQVICWPQAGNVVGTYYQTIPELSTAGTNWLLTLAPDLYLFASLVESILYTQDDSRLPIWADKAAVLLEAVQGADNANAINGGPLQARVR